MIRRKERMEEEIEDVTFLACRYRGILTMPESEFICQAMLYNNNPITKKSLTRSISMHF